MSERKTDWHRLTDAVGLLLQVLIKQGLVDGIRLLNMLGEREVVKIHFSRRYDYDKVADWLRSYGVIFLPISRKRAYFAHKKLEEMLKDEGWVEKERAEWGDEKGYLFYFLPKPKEKEENEV
ncbi:MAG: hypothetical protein ACXQTS_06900 [Candidatus Methanospirareceae archaeon]